MLDTTININIVLVGRPYKLKVEPSEESIVRQAAKEINDQVQDYQQKFPSKDKQDFLVMLLLQQRVDALKRAAAAGKTDEWADKLDALDQLLTKHLSTR